MELTGAEIAVAEKDIDTIGYGDHTVLHSAICKIKNGSDKNLISVYTTRLATSIDRSRVPHHEKAKHWKTAAIRAEEANIPCSGLYSLAADMYGKDMAHNTSAELFDASIKHALIEKVDKVTIRRLFQDCRRQYELSGDSLTAGKIFIAENDYRLKEAKGFEKIFLFSYKTLSSYGESPARVAISAFVIIICCAILYYIGGIYSSVNQELVHSLPTSIYFSVVTFTTLGYGDYSPATILTRLVASFQAISGLLLTSLFLVTTVRKYSR